ncbi:MAG: PEPxxWA-CTERM sorting domain-containing protein [Caulobacterales bacterium]|jgi:hypothetical protein
MRKYVVVAALTLGLGFGTAASAAVVTHIVGADVLGSPYTFNLGTAGFTFGVTGGSLFSDSTVQTSGSGQILSLGAPFYDPPRPSSFFVDRGSESVGPGSGLFTSFATPADIPFSSTDSLVGFSFGDTDGTHYGYAEVAGANFTGYRFETTAGASVPFAAVPEPASWALMIGGFGMVGGLLRRRRTQPALPAATFA